jgi:hypothetical protein
MPAKRNININVTFLPSSCFILLHTHPPDIVSNWHSIWHSSRGSSVGIGRYRKGLLTGPPDFIPGRGKRFFLYSTASRSALGPTQPPNQWAPGALSLGVKRPGAWNRPLPSSAETWSYTSTPLYVFVVWCLINLAQLQLDLTFYLPY